MKSMRMLGTVDLEVLQIAVAGDGTINESMLERSSMKDRGVGRTLDALASLRDRGLLELDKNNGSFNMTPAAYDILWSDAIPLWARILRLLEIRSCTKSEASIMLCVADARGHNKVGDAFDKLQRAGLVMMAPQVRSGRPEKIYEILPEGERALEAGQDAGGVFESQIPAGIKTGPLVIIDEIEQMVRGSESTTNDESRAILQKLSGLRDAISEMSG